MIKKISKTIIISILRFVQRILVVWNNYVTPPYKLVPKTIVQLSSTYELFLNDEINDCYKHFKKYFNETIFLDTIPIREFSIKKAIENDQQNENFYLEFGVWKGTSIRLFSSIIKNKKIYGFDSFEGLEENMHGYRLQKGHMDLKGIAPELPKNVILIKGRIQNTLPTFIERNKNLKINFVHIDVDTYEITKFILQKIKPLLIDKAVILFDELYNFSGWRTGEYKALKEEFSENEYKYLSFAVKGCQTAIQIIKK